MSEPQATAEIEPKPWTWGLGHNYISLFLTAVFLDRLGPSTLGVGGLGSAALGAALAGLLAFGLLFYPSAHWGLRTRKPLSEVAPATFGGIGAKWVPGALLGIAQMIWFASALALAADYGARGLLCWNLLTPSEIADWSLGGLTLKAPPILFETICWGLFAAVMGTLAVRIVSAVMYTYPVFPAIALGYALVATLPGLGRSAIEPIVMPEPSLDARLVGFLAMVQLVTGFFAPSGLLAADWGAVSRDARDIRLGGLCGVALASAVLAAITLTVVAHTLGPIPRPAETLRQRPDPEDKTPEARLARLLAGDPATPDRPSPPADADGTLGSALQLGIGGTTGGALLLVFALGLLGPCVYCPFLYVRQFEAILPGVPRLVLGLAGAVLAWPLVATGLALCFETIFSLMGAAFGPVAGAIAADWLRHRGAWPGPRSGWNPPGWIAWGVGLVVGLLPLIGQALRVPCLEQFQPATLLAFLAAFLVFLGLSRAGETPPPVSVEPNAEPPSTSP
jgi:cytosine permease